MKIIIIGAGISGLTIAHELVEKNFDIEIYEKDNIIGGMAKSIRTKNYVPTEHSWRGYGPFYYNFFNIAKRIPIDNLELFNEYTKEEVSQHNTEDDFWAIYKNEVYDLTDFVNDHPGGSIILNSAGQDLEEVWYDFGYEWHMSNNNVMRVLKKYKIGKLVEVKEEFYKGKTVFDNLVKEGLDFRFWYNKDDDKKSHDLTYADLYYLTKLFGNVILSKDKNEYYNVRLDPLIKKNLSKAGYHYIADYIAGPGYGFDKNTMSLGHYADFVEYNLNENKRWKVMNQPTNEAWIDPWVNFLKQKGVKFFTNHELKFIKTSNNKITKLIFSNNKIVQGDDYVIAINPFNYSDILKNNDMDYKLYDKLNIVNNQISFRLGYDKKINFHNLEYGGFVLVDSPYNITFYAQEDHWKDNIKLGMDGKIKTLLSGTIILPYNKGSLYKKSGLSLTLDQLKEEIIHQIYECEKFINFCNESGVKKENIVFKEIYEDWYETDNFLKTKNKKWVNNFLNEDYRPLQKTKFSNLFLSGAHCKTSISIWSMEGAVESGKITSNLILSKYKLQLCDYHKHQSNLLICLLKESDFLIKIILIIILIYIYNGKSY
jgi:uncharacterized protein with NAD-binding domain and iron-sulfur cluster